MPRTFTVSVAVDCGYDFTWCYSPLEWKPAVNILELLLVLQSGTVYVVPRFLIQRNGQNQQSWVAF